MTKLCLSLPLRTKSVANSREHWKARHRRVLRERGPVGLALQAKLTKEPWAKADVWLTRVAPRFLDDDNLRVAMKGVRDSIAAALELPSDRDPRVQWVYGQRRGKAREYGVEVSIEFR